MFKVKRVDGELIEFDVYATREIDVKDNLYKIQFLIFHKNTWQWIYAKDFIPV